MGGLGNRHLKGLKTQREFLSFLSTDRRTNPPPTKKIRRKRHSCETTNTGGTELLQSSAMEVGRNLVSLHPPNFPPKTHFRNSLPSSSVTMLHEVAAPAVTSLPTTSLTRQFPASISLQEQREEVRSLLHTREEKTSQVALDRKQLDGDASFVQEKKDCGSNQYLKDFERHLLDWPGLWYLLPSLQSEEKSCLSLSMQPTAPDRDNILNNKDSNVLALAKQTRLAAKEANYLAEALNSNEDDSGEFIPGSGLTNSSLLEKEIAVRSKRHLERRSKKRKVHIQKAIVHDPKLRNEQRKLRKKFDPNNPLGLFLSNSMTDRFLTKKEEIELFIHVQELVRLEEVKQSLQSEFCREPTFIEWAEAAEMSFGTLQFHILSGNSSREKMIYSNFRMVVHLAKQYQGMGLDIQDLLQEGARGLIKSLKMFQPREGCRFSSYAYFWVRQYIRKAIFQNSRTIRLPEDIFNIMRKVSKAKNLYIQEGHQPTSEELAKRVGISVQRLEILLVCTRNPLSMQTIALGGDGMTTFQSLTEDPNIEDPSRTVTKQHMRQHMRNLLSILPPRERRIIRLRFGIGGGTRKPLEEIGVEFGLTKERVRQLEAKALDSLRKCISCHGLEAYTDLLQ